MQRSAFSKLQYITSGANPAEHYAHAQRALDHGITWLQLRIKNEQAAGIRKIAEQIQQLKSRYTFTFIINDHPLLAKEVDADGVHLGLTDMPVMEARRILGVDKIIGGTANTLEDLLLRTNERCDYIGLGPLRHTATKEKLSPLLGYEGYAQVMAQIKDNPLVPPVFAIGGILPEDLVHLIPLGIYGVALSKFLQDNFNNPSVITQITATL